MPRVVLLNPNDPMFSFEHAMTHRRALAVLSPLTRFSVLPYLLDPAEPRATAANKWMLNHQQAHNDALRNLPSQYYWPPVHGTTTETIPNPNPPPPTITVTVPTVKDRKVTHGLRVGGNLIDHDLGNPRQLTWWTFQNHMEHYAAARTVAPTPAPHPAPAWRWPFW